MLDMDEHTPAPPDPVHGPRPAAGHGHAEHDASGSRDQDHHRHGHGHRHPGGLLGRLREVASPHAHDAAVAVDTELETSRQGIRALIVSFAGLAVTAGLQALVVWRSGSVALLGDTLHNLADALTAVPLAVAFTVGRRAATRRYTYGYGRAEDLAGIVVVVFIAASSALAAYEAVGRLLDPSRSAPSGWSPRRRWSGLPAMNWWPVTASGWGARSARPRWSPTGCTPAPTR
jgi:Cation efflux family